LAGLIDEGLPPSAVIIPLNMSAPAVLAGYMPTIPARLFGVCMVRVNAHLWCDYQQVVF
jgi:hypothetical protein